MNIEKLNRGLTLVANFGVLAGILFLAQEIQQSNRIAIANSEIEIRSSYGPLNEAIYGDPELAMLLIKAQSSDQKLDTVEQVRLAAWLRQLTNQWIAIEIAYNNGMVPVGTYETIFDDQRQIVRDAPAARPLFRKTIDNHPALSETATVRSINQLLQEYGT
ncbi:MAG: hypothetical protein ACI9BW_002402 [Gammaproteobacteria bacterium]|jgi:hypothetical protein